MATQAEQNVAMMDTLTEIKAQLDRIEAAVAPPPEEPTDGTDEQAAAPAAASTKGKHHV